MSAVTKLSVRTVFADNTKTTITIDNINPETGVNPNIKNIIRNFNAQSGGELSTKLKSKSGANWIGIDKATITTTNRVYIF